MNTFDNIVAPATGTGGAITILRISGPAALEIGNRIWSGKTPLEPASARMMKLGRVGIDSALAVCMPGPGSYTGDDVVELHCHGGAAVAEQALKLALDAGCRMAEPGEFTFRAFVNGKLDLTQAEAVADVVSAGSDLALKVAERQLAGALGEELDQIYWTINEFRAECESRLDFPEEELDWDSALPEKMERVSDALKRLLATRQIGSTLRDGVDLVLAGRPNAGKSSLLNLLLGYERAIVSPVPGTTRDTVEAETVLRGIPVRITDTAGLRDSSDPVERLGVERSRRSIAAAHLTIWLLDAAADDLEAEITEFTLHAPVDNRIAVWNKIDLASERNLPEIPGGALRISVKNRENIDSLLDAVAERTVHSARPAEPPVAVNARAADELEKAVDAVADAKTHSTEGMFEIAAARLRDALQAVGAITGKNDEPDELDQIFSRICIGK